MSALDKLNNRAKKAEEKPVIKNDNKKSEKKQTENINVKPVIEKKEEIIQEKQLTEIVNADENVNNLEKGVQTKEVITNEMVISSKVKTESKPKISAEPKKRGRPRLEEKCRFTIYVPESKEDLLQLAMKATGKKANECIVEAACKYFEDNKANFESIIKLKEQLNL